MNQFADQKDLFFVSFFFFFVNCYPNPPQSKAQPTLRHEPYFISTISSLCHNNCLFFCFFLLSFCHLEAMANFSCGDWVWLLHNYFSWIPVTIENVNANGDTVLNMHGTYYDPSRKDKVQLNLSFFLHFEILPIFFLCNSN